MVSKEDKKAAFILLGLAAVGLIVRLVAGGDGAPGAVLYRDELSDTVSRDTLAAQAARLARPLVSGERIDIDKASVVELTRLPRIGPSLAARIVSDRERNGPFGSPAGLGRVSGVGPKLLEGIEPFSQFSGRPVTRSGQSAEARIRINVATAEQLASLPGIGMVKAQAIVDDRSRRGRYGTLEDLSRVRGIGAATIERLRPLVVVP
jgi:competence protein ComEA